MWKNKKVSVIFPAFNEEENILQAIEDFFSCRYVDEIVVVDNNSTDRTPDLVKRTKARLVKETRPGLGWAIRRGLKEAAGDYIIIAEPDGTFIGKDVEKLLVYSDEFDLVLGTRTSKGLIWKGANMKGLLRWGNWVAAKFLEILFNGPSLTDVGCTMRLIKKEKLNQIIDKLTVGGSHCNPELVILSLLYNFKVVEIPLNYLPRKGYSKITGKWTNVIKVGVKMVLLMLKYRIKSIFKKI
ncbi:MAG: glycosyltransferase family 2 protein [Endomicrobiia bacterium]